MKLAPVVFLVFSSAALWMVQCDSIKITEFESHPHNKDCYSQGLFFLNHTHIFQSCGLYDKSYFHILKYDNSKIADDQSSHVNCSFSLEEVKVSQKPYGGSRIFLEGATYFPKNNKIYVLTWRQNKVYMLNRETFELQKTLKWPKMGWGLTNNATHMFLTDGSSTMYLVDEEMNVVDQKSIIDEKGYKVRNLNELECVSEQDGRSYVYANVYMERRIIKIDFEAGKVVQEFDCLTIIRSEKGLKYDEVINGIAYIEAEDKFLLTGKNWANFYKVTLK